VLTEEQLRLWIEHPSFYDRDASWVGSLESAATYAPGKVFGLYMPAEPNPWFLQIEHFGARYATTVAPENVTYGDPLLLTLFEAALETNSTDRALAGLGRPGRTFNELAAENDMLRNRLQTLTHSRSALFKALVAAMTRKLHLGAGGGRVEP
jgi:hypothetical protein